MFCHPSGGAQFSLHSFLEMYTELVAMRKACGEAHMKAILAIGELATLNNVWKAGMVSMMAGKETIKVGQ